MLLRRCIDSSVLTNKTTKTTTFWQFCGIHLVTGIDCEDQSTVLEGETVFDRRFRPIQLEALSGSSLIGNLHNLEHSIKYCCILHVAFGHKLLAIFGNYGVEIHGKTRDLHFQREVAAGLLEIRGEREACCCTF